MAEQQDREFFRNYMIVIGLLGIMIIAFIVFAVSFGSRDNSYIEERADEVADMTLPYGRLRTDGQPIVEENVSQSEVTAVEATSAEPEDMGKKVYSGLCFSCHGTGLPNIPQLGDTATWEPRIALGSALLYERAITGFTGESGMPMPARGGNPALTDEEIQAAVDYMVTNSQ
jgi:cytochrome c5